MRFKKLGKLKWLVFYLFIGTSGVNAQEKVSIAEINDFWNKSIVYSLEGKNKQGKSLDRWQEPKVTWDKKEGDCEDIAIAKYFSLIASGVDRKDVYLAWVVMNNPSLNIKKNESHVVVVYRNKGKLWVLDNYSSEIVELQARVDFIKFNAVLDHKEFRALKEMNEVGMKVALQWNNIIRDFDKHVGFIKNNKLLAKLNIQKEENA